jgi:peptidoglycan/LPS O-acetylase OafA/YrhL
MDKKMAKTMPSKMSTTSYLLYLDGLRAVAIVGVLIFHNDNTWLSGGFLGVDIFFVISGFIITKLLYDEWNKTGTLNFKHFWFRRLRRLVPAAFVMMVTTLVFVLTLFPDEIVQISEDFPYGITFTNNWNYIINERSYFELIGRPRLFEHLWSLGVEFQFYSIWLFSCFMLFRLPRWAICLLIVYMALYSAFVMAFLYNPKEDPSRVYFGTDTRSSSLFIGALVALILDRFELPLSKIKCHAINVIGIFGVIGLVLFFIYAKPTDTFLFRGGFLGVSLLTAIVIGSCLIMSYQNYSK